jgi:hypothetical protein
VPAFGKDHAQSKGQSVMAIQLEAITLWGGVTGAASIDER